MGEDIKTKYLEFFKHCVKTLFRNTISFFFINEVKL